MRRKHMEIWDFKEKKSIKNVLPTTHILLCEDFNQEYLEPK